MAEMGEPLMTAVVAAYIGFGFGLLVGMYVTWRRR